MQGQYLQLTHLANQKSYVAISGDDIFLFFSATRSQNFLNNSGKSCMLGHNNLTLYRTLSILIPHILLLCTL